MKSLKKETKLIIGYLALLILLVSFISFIEVIKEEEIVFSDDLIKKTGIGYQLKLENTTIPLTNDEYEYLYMYEGDTYQVTYKYNRFSPDKKELVGTRYIFELP